MTKRSSSDSNLLLTANLVFARDVCTQRVNNLVVVIIALRNVFLTGRRHNQISSQALILLIEPRMQLFAKSSEKGAQRNSKYKTFLIYFNF